MFMHTKEPLQKYGDRKWSKNTSQTSLSSVKYRPDKEIRLDIQTQLEVGQ